MRQFIKSVGFPYLPLLFCTLILFGCVTEQYKKEKAFVDEATAFINEGRYSQAYDFIGEKLKGDYAGENYQPDQTASPIAALLARIEKSTLKRGTKKKLAALFEARRSETESQMADENACMHKLREAIKRYEYDVARKTMAGCTNPKASDLTLKVLAGYDIDRLEEDRLKHLERLQRANDSMITFLKKDKRIMLDCVDSQEICWFQSKTEQSKAKYTINLSSADSDNLEVPEDAFLSLYGGCRHDRKNISDPLILRITMNYYGKEVIRAHTYSLEHNYEVKLYVDGTAHAWVAPFNFQMPYPGFIREYTDTYVDEERLAILRKMVTAESVVFEIENKKFPIPKKTIDRLKTVMEIYDDLMKIYTETQ